MDHCIGKPDHVSGKADPWMDDKSVNAMSLKIISWSFKVSFQNQKGITENSRGGLMNSFGTSCESKSLYKQRRTNPAKMIYLEKVLIFESGLGYLVVHSVCFNKIPYKDIHSGVKRTDTKFLFKHQGHKGFVKGHKGLLLKKLLCDLQKYSALSAVKKKFRNVIEWKK
jgi:hypothetical protein